MTMEKIEESKKVSLFSSFFIILMQQCHAIQLLTQLNVSLVREEEQKWKYEILCCIMNGKCKKLDEANNSSTTTTTSGISTYYLCFCPWLFLVLGKTMQRCCRCSFLSKRNSTLYISLLQFFLDSYDFRLYHRSSVIASSHSLLFPVRWGDQRNRRGSKYEIYTQVLQTQHLFHC